MFDKELKRKVEYLDYQVENLREQVNGLYTYFNLKIEKRAIVSKKKKEK